jgi:hypothetical protein
VNIELRRLIPLDFPPEILRERLFAWARLTGFTLPREEGDCWTFERGSSWWALITFNVRKVPTTLRVLYLPLSSSLACSLQCDSWAQFETRGDRKRLEQDLDDLILFVSEGRPSETDKAAAPLPLPAQPTNDRIVGRSDAFSKS